MPSKKIFIILDGDTDAICGVVETDKSYKIVQDTIDKYRKESPDCIWEDLKEYLITNGFDIIEYEEVYF